MIRVRSIWIAGLALATSISASACIMVKQYGLSVQSEYNIGTCATLIIPARQGLELTEEVLATELGKFGQTTS
jgi:hypothetical protein